MGKNSKFNNTLTLRVVNALRNGLNGKMQLIVSSQCAVVGNFPIVVNQSQDLEENCTAATLASLTCLQ